MKKGYVYILGNRNRSILYTGVTLDLMKRIYQHKNKLAKGFASKYNCVDLLWWQESDCIESAIAREKQIKGGSRARKEALIESMNPDWIDLSKNLFEN